MIPTAPLSNSRASRKRISFLLASGLSRVAMTGAFVAVIWVVTGWAMGWW